VPTGGQPAGHRESAADAVHGRSSGVRVGLDDP
jgi:hypothetical protein